MTGKITVGTIQDTDGNTVTSTYVTNGVAKHWTSWNQSGTLTVADSFNQSSLTDEASAYTTVAFTSNMGNDDYAYSGCCQGSTHGQTIFCEYLTSNKLTSATQVRTLHNQDNSAQNPDDVMMHTHGDLA
jgi:hypothetical protein